MQASS